MTKPDVRRVLDALDAWDTDDAIDAEMRRALELKPEQIETELRAKGLDVERERAKADAALDSLASGPASSDSALASSAEPTAWVTPAAPSGRTLPAMRWAVLLAAALAAAAGGGVLYALAHQPKPNEGPIEVPGPQQVPQAPPRATLPTPSQEEIPSTAPDNGLKPRVPRNK